MDFPLSDKMFKHESDRGVVLVGAAMLDETLERLLRALFASEEASQKKSIALLFGANGPLSSYWAKLHFANSLGVLKPELYSDLEIIRKLRNSFAHKKEPADFGEKAIMELVKSFSIATEFETRFNGKFSYVRAERGKPVSEFKLLEKGYVKSARGAFIGCLVISLGKLERTVAAILKSREKGAT